MKKAFHGGIHIADKKELTDSKKEILTLSPPIVKIPLLQHIGSAAKAVVNKNDYVYKGQLIGNAEGLSSPVHASVSGYVKDVTEDFITIENDFKGCEKNDLTPFKDPEGISAEELFKTIRAAGIVGLGGAAFPTDKKAISAYKSIDTLIINACECEPYISSDNALILTECEKALKGVALLYNALSPKKCIIATENNKPEAVAILKAALMQFENISLAVLPTRYPQGSEKQLIFALTGREVPPQALPTNVSCSVFNISTAFAVYRAVYEGKPLTERIVSVTGENIFNPQNFWVPVGTEASFLIEKAGGLKNKSCPIIFGGPMMGKEQKDSSSPITKATGSVLCICPQKAAPTGCIHCGKCVSVCPMRLLPLYLYSAKDKITLKRLNISDCIECGCCSYICPSRLPLTESFHSLKIKLREDKK